jgi:hypothetical protein
MYDDILLADGFNDALLGISSKNIAIYDVDKCITILEKQGMSQDDAVEYFYFNVEGSYVGEQTPIWIHTDKAKDILLEESPKSKLRIYKAEA